MIRKKKKNEEVLTMIDVKDAELLLLISKALDLGLIGSIQKEDGAIVISHVDGEILSFEPCLNDLKIYLAGLLKSWDLICCGQACPNDQNFST